MNTLAVQECRNGNSLEFTVKAFEHAIQVPTRARVL